MERVVKRLGLVEQGSRVAWILMIVVFGGVVNKVITYQLAKDVTPVLPLIDVYAKIIAGQRDAAQWEENERNFGVVTKDCNARDKDCNAGDKFMRSKESTSSLEANRGNVVSLPASKQCFSQAILVLICKWLEKLEATSPDNSRLKSRKVTV
jgi:hypothetical protein